VERALLAAADRPDQFVIVWPRRVGAQRAAHRLAVSGFSLATLPLADSFSIRIASSSICSGLKYRTGPRSANRESNRAGRPGGAFTLIIARISPRTALFDSGLPMLAFGFDGGRSGMAGEGAAESAARTSR
jgi:hypothetical protein